MDIRLNPKDQLPIHAQLKAQLTLLIESGQLEPNTQLPTVRELAGFLRINRNTVSKVFTELEREGYLVCARGKGTFVSPQGSQTQARTNNMIKLLNIVDEAIREAGKIGFTPEELSVAVYARTRATNDDQVPAKARLLFVECNQPQVDLFSATLQKDLALPVEGLLLANLARIAAEAPEHFKQYTLILTSFQHFEEVQALLRETGAEVLGLLINASFHVLMKLRALPAGTTVGVSCLGPMGSENMRLSITQAGMTHLNLITTCGEDEEGLEKMIDAVSVIVCSCLIEERMRLLTPPGKTIIVDDRQIDPAGIEMLRRRLRDIAADLPDNKTR